jgi:hypothetical protein
MGLLTFYIYFRQFKLYFDLLILGGRSKGDAERRQLSPHSGNVQSTVRIFIHTGISTKVS